MATDQERKERRRDFFEWKRGQTRRGRAQGGLARRRAAILFFFIRRSLFSVFQYFPLCGDVPVEPQSSPFRALRLERLHVARRDHEKARALAKRFEQLVPHRLGGVPSDERPVVGAPQRSGRGKQKPQDVVDLGRGPDGGAGRTPRRLLLDRERRQDVLDQVDVGALEAFEVLARVRGHGFDEPALALRVERVEGERGFP